MTEEIKEMINEKKQSYLDSNKDEKLEEIKNATEEIEKKLIQKFIDSH